MAKGDASGQPQQPQAPKMDQYSVMHGIMDRLDQGGANMAGSMMPSQISMPNSPSALNIPNSTIPMQPRPSNMGGSRPIFGGGGQMGAPLGQYGRDFTPMGQGSWNMQPQSIAPGNPTELIRRMMMGNNTA